MYLDAPHHPFLWRLATASLLATDAQIEAQNAPIDMLLLALKPAYELRLHCQLLPKVGTIGRPQAPLLKFQGPSFTIQVSEFLRSTVEDEKDCRQGCI